MNFTWLNFYRRFFVISTGVTLIGVGALIAVVSTNIITEGTDSVSDVIPLEVAKIGELLRKPSSFSEEQKRTGVKKDIKEPKKEKGLPSPLPQPVVTVSPSCIPELEWKQGERQRYRLQWSASTQIFNIPNKGAGKKRPQQKLHLDIRGILNFRVVEEKNETVRVALQLSEPQVNVNRARAEGMERIFEKLFFVTFSREGLPLHFDLPSLSEKDQHFLTELIYSLQVVLPKQESSTTGEWSIEEKNMIGDYQARYRVDSESCKIHKEKVHFTSLQQRGEKVSLSVPFPQSHASVRFKEGTSWINEFHAQEQLEMFHAEKFLISRTHSEIALKSIPFLEEPDLAIWEPSPSVEENFPQQVAKVFPVL